MRVISGIAGGVVIASPRDNAIRPTSDRVKESIFAVLGDLRGRTVVDLFAGSGALGLEALSRGAAKVIFVERKRSHVRLIEDNLAIVRKAMGDQSGEAVVLQTDAMKIARHPGIADHACDVILADPPYHRDECCANELLSAPGFAAFAAAAIIVLEHDKNTKIDTSPASGWRLLKRSAFGSTGVSYLKCGLAARPAERSGARLCGAMPRQAGRP